MALIKNVKTKSEIELLKEKRSKIDKQIEDIERFGLKQKALNKIHSLTQAYLNPKKSKFRISVYGSEHLITVALDKLAKKTTEFLDLAYERSNGIEIEFEKMINTLKYDYNFINIPQSDLENWCRKWHFKLKDTQEALAEAKSELDNVIAENQAWAKSEHERQEKATEEVMKPKYDFDIY